MKLNEKILLLSIGLFSCFANAKPNLGDYSVLAGTVVSGDGTIQIQSRTENVQIDENSQKILVRNTQYTEGQPDYVNEEWKDMNSVYDAESAPYVIRNSCKDRELEIISTPAGTFETCRIQVEGDDVKGFIWIGPVPGFDVKMEITNNDGSIRQSLLLQEFAWK